MKDNEIIKALECCRDCKCKDCPCHNKETDGCQELDEQDILDLIKRQKAEIDILIRKKDSLRDEIAEQQAKIERLQKSNEEMFCTISKQDAEITQLQKRIVFWREDMNYQLKTAKAEAIKEFAEMIIMEYPEVDYFVSNLVKEMTEQ